MNSSTRSYSCARVVFAALVFAAFSWTVVGIVSRQLHAHIHADANHADHLCAITLIAVGSYEQAGQPVLVGAPELKNSLSCQRGTQVELGSSAIEIVRVRGKRMLTGNRKRTFVMVGA